MEATRFMGSRDESSVQGPPLMEENDEVDRLTISASMWMAARLQTVKCLVQLMYPTQPCCADLAIIIADMQECVCVLLTVLGATQPRTVVLRCCGCHHAACVCVCHADGQILGATQPRTVTVKFLVHHSHAQWCCAVVAVIMQLVCVCHADCQVLGASQPRTATVKCLVQLRHARPCYALVAAALKEAEQANDGLAAVQLLHAQVGLPTGGTCSALGGQELSAVGTEAPVGTPYHVPCMKIAPLFRMTLLEQANGDAPHQSSSRGSPSGGPAGWRSVTLRLPPLSLLRPIASFLFLSSPTMRSGWFPMHSIVVTPKCSACSACSACAAQAMSSMPCIGW
eukprot:1158066-Pelagomonas_calceolata.AAC.6